MVVLTFTVAHRTVGCEWKKGVGGKEEAVEEEEEEEEREKRQRRRRQTKQRWIR